MPEIQKSPALMQMLLTWLDDYLSDMGAEVGSFNDNNLNDNTIQPVNNEQLDLTDKNKLDKKSVSSTSNLSVNSFDNHSKSSKVYHNLRKNKFKYI